MDSRESDSCGKLNIHSMEDLGYAQVSPDFVAMSAESVGIPNLADDIVYSLSEDISYRLRDLAHISAQLFRHGKQPCLTSDDFNEALQLCDSTPVYGHFDYDNQEFVAYDHFRDGDLFVLQEKELKLDAVIDNPPKPQIQPQPSVKAHWLTSDDYPLGQNDTQTTRDAPTAAHHEYYCEVVRACFGEDDVQKLLLKDLITNPRLNPIMPRLLHWCAVSLQDCLSSQSGEGEVHTTPQQFFYTLQVLLSLVQNNHVSLAVRQVIEEVVVNLTQCVVNPFQDGGQMAAVLIGKLAQHCGTTFSGLGDSVATTASDLLQDSDQSSLIHQGALLLLYSLGMSTVVQYLVPLIPKYMEKVAEGRGRWVEGMKVADGIRNIFVSLFKLAQSNPNSQILAPLTQPATVKSEDQPDPALSNRLTLDSLYNLLEDFFGDQFSIFISPCNFSSTNSSIPCQSGSKSWDSTQHPSKLLWERAVTQQWYHHKVTRNKPKLNDVFDISSFRASYKPMQFYFAGAAQVVEGDLRRRKFPQTFPQVTNSQKLRLIKKRYFIVRQNSVLQWRRKLLSCSVSSVL